MWDAKLEAELGAILEDNHRLTFTFTLPDQSRYVIIEYILHLIYLKGSHTHLVYFDLTVFLSQKKY